MRHTTRIQRRPLIFLIGIILLFFGVVPLSSSNLQSAAAATPAIITSITGNTVTGNVSTQVVPPQSGGNVYGIRGGQTVGSNLFHSFGQFNVGPGDTAQFQTSNLSPTTAISNILGRVNGQQSPSQIFGTIDSFTFYPSANLFLMNPYGFLFGPNATINVGGMVAFTSADYLRLQGAGGDGIFYAGSAANSILTSAPVAAFGFLGSNPGAITVQGSQLSITPGQSLSLVGGNITIQSGTLDNGTVQPALLSAPGGQINIAGVASPGEVLASNLQLQPNVNSESFTSLGSISIGQDARIDSSGTTSGAVAIRGGQLLVADGATITSAAILGLPPPAGSVTINGSGVQLTGSDVALNGTNVSVTGATVTATNLDGSGGMIAITAGTTAQPGNVTVAQGALLDASGNGGGTVLIRGGQFLLDNSTILAQVTGPGPVTHGAEAIGGGIDILVAQNAVIQNGAVIDTSISGNATPGMQYSGVTIKADRVEVRDSGIFSDSMSNTGGNSGDIKLEANSILVNDSGAFTTILETSTQGAGNAGNIILTADGNLELNGAQLLSSTQGAGNAGNILLSAGGNLEITNSLLETDALIGSTGNGGNIALTSTNGNLVLSEAPAIITTSASTGNAGNITLTSTNGNISIDGAFITSQDVPQTIGTVGNITVGAPVGDILLTDAILGTRIQGTGATGHGAFQFTANHLTLVNSLIGIDNFSSVQSGNLVINLNGTLSLSGPNAQSIIQTTTRGAAQSADLNITAHDVLLTDASIVATSTFGAGDAGTLNVVAQNLTLTNGAQLTSSSIFKPNPPPGQPIVTPSGAAGTVNVHGPAGSATSVLINGAGSEILTTTEGTGAGGNINITSQSLTLQNGGTLSASTTGTGNAGSILVKGDSVSITGGAQMTSNSSMRQTPLFNGEVIPPPSGNAGNITIQGLASPAQSVLIDGAGSGLFTTTSGTGAGGDIAVNAHSVTLQHGGTLSAATTGTASSATGGSITVTANQVALNTQGLITADTTGIAPAGVVELNTGSLALTGGGQIRSSSGAATPPLAAAALLAAPAAPLTGGTITVQGPSGAGSQAQSVTIDGAGSGLFTKSTGNRPGGDITLHTNGSVTLTNGASISASSTGTGNAGNIQITAGNQFTMTNSTVTTEAEAASGGTITITTTPNGTVQLTNSTISASVLDGTGGGGSVSIDPQYVFLVNSQITANAVFGPGGKIFITTDLLLPDAISVISASSQFGQNGTVTIQSPIAPASGKILPLPQRPLIATTLLSQRCAALAGGEFSSFTVAGRDSLPAEPSGWLASPLAFAALGAGMGLEARGEGESLSAPDEGREARGEGRPPLTPPYQGGGDGEGEPPLLSLRQIAPPGFLTRSFAADSSGGCTS